MSPAKESPLVEPETAASVHDTTGNTDSEKQSESAEEEDTELAEDESE